MENKELPLVTSIYDISAEALEDLTNNRGEDDVSYTSIQ